uniref:Potassium channel domain-containing protein n=2 Tax=Lutzomyia longipalpis TaxID=7200 RepID=A0A1B0CQM4_LUTLO
MCTQVGVGALIVGYALVGAAAFMSIETQEANPQLEQAMGLRRNCALDLWAIVEEHNLFNNSVWKHETDDVLMRFQTDFAALVKKGYDGRTPDEKWTFPAALMFCLSVFTMIGYGNMVPRTQWGKGTTVIYATFGIPLYILYFLSMGKVLAQCFKWLYRWFHECSHEGGSDVVTIDPESGLPKKVIVPSTACLWVIIAYVVTGTVMFAEWEGWNYLDSAYFCVTSLCKIGIGDFVPGANILDSQSGKQTKLAINFVYMLFGMGLVAMAYNLMREEGLSRNIHALGRVGRRERKGENRRRNLLGASHRKRRRMLGNNPARCTGGGGPIRLTGVSGFEGRVNDVIYCPPLQKHSEADGEEPENTAVVYFGGDIQGLSRNIHALGRVGRRERKGENRRRNLLGASHRKRRRMLGNNPARCTGGGGPIRLTGVSGFEGRVNDVIYCPPLQKHSEADGEEPENTAVVYFGGDIQAYIKYNLENTALMLRNNFPKSHIVIIKAVRMEFKTFSCYDNFVRGCNAGIPDHTPMNHALQHLEKTSDFPENMQVHRDSKAYIKYNLENTALMLRNNFPKSHIVIIKAVRMEFKTFSCYDNFVRGCNAGIPDHTPMNHALQHLEKLLQNIPVRIRSIPESELISQITASANSAAASTATTSTVTSNSAGQDTGQDMDIDILQVQDTVNVESDSGIGGFSCKDNACNSIPRLPTDLSLDLLQTVIDRKVKFSKASTATTSTVTSNSAGQDTGQDMDIDILQVQDTVNVESDSGIGGFSCKDNACNSIPRLPTDLSLDLLQAAEESVGSASVPNASDLLWWRDSLNLDKAQLTLIAFSKGSVVLNQFIYEFHYLKTLTPDDSSMMRLVSRIRDMYWLDGGHSAPKNTWITSRSLLETLTRLNINLHVHVTPYQVLDDRRPWIRRDEKAFTDLLKRLGASLTRMLHFDTGVTNLFTHFEVLEVFRQAAPEVPAQPEVAPTEGTSSTSTAAAASSGGASQEASKSADGEDN